MCIHEAQQWDTRGANVGLQELLIGSKNEKFT